MLFPGPMQDRQSPGSDLVGFYFDLEKLTSRSLPMRCFPPRKQTTLLVLVLRVGDARPYEMGSTYQYPSKLLQHHCQQQLTI